MARISTVDELRGRYRDPVERVVRKELNRLDEHCRTYIGGAPFLVLATVGADGRLDASPRGDRPGFVQIPDERTLLIPDWPGNNRLDSLTNLVEHPRAGLIFMIPGVDETLRVNGVVAIHDDDGLRDRFLTGARRPAVVLVVTVEQAYLHCAKAFMRSGLWNPKTWPAERPVPTMGAMIHDQIDEVVPAETQEAMIARYLDGLY
jgi:PPOX class probable FMN-dependent enzyme